MSTCTLCGLTFNARYSYGLCSRCFSKDKCREYDRVESAVRAAQRQRVYPISLTLPEWLSAVSDWKGLCSFCEEYSFSLIEMIEPSKGLVYANVVPACRACSTIRRVGMDTAEQKVRDYLKSERPIKLFNAYAEEEPPHAEYH
jgi:hypothetical protein